MDKETRFLTYSPWPGQLNNTRMCFETALVLAYLSGRCLVTPKAYRTQQQAEWEGGRFRPLHPGEYLDLDSLKSLVEIISHDEYERLPRDMQSDKVGLVFEPGTAVLCYPAIPDPHSKEAVRLRDFAAGRRRFLELTPRLASCRTLELRSPALEQFYSFFYADGQWAQHCKRLVRDHVKFKAEIIVAGTRIARALGSYGAIHVRRNDFLQQQTDQDIPGDPLLRTLLARIPVGTCLYIATDETDRNFFRTIRNHYESYFIEDCKSAIPPGMSVAHLACIEQMVCTFALVFVGTRLSTFSAYINRLRGYYGASDKNVYFTDGSPGSQMDDEGSPPFSWINWLRRGNPLWGREFKEGWELAPA
jgi:hypothetical protein